MILRTPQNSRDQIFMIEALRGLAALSVTWFHLTQTYQWSWVRYTGEYGWLGVDVFFVISGFIIPYSLHRSGYEFRNFPQFIAKRLLRLEPPYILSVMLVIALWELSSRFAGFAGATPEYSIPQILSHLLYVVPFTSFSWISPVYWSLAYEFAFYISVGLLWPALSSRHVLLTVLVFVVAQIISAAFVGEGNGRILLFLIGICGARYIVRIDQFELSACIFALTIPAVAALSGAATAIVASATIILIVFVELRPFAPLRFLGAVSYSLYLIHVPIGGRVVNLGRRFIDQPIWELTLSIVALIGSLSAAAVFWKLIELPARRAAKRIPLGRHAQESAPLYTPHNADVVADRPTAAATAKSDNSTG